jgi:hypothetical protein
LLRSKYGQLIEMLSLGGDTIDCGQMLATSTRQSLRGNSN